MTKTFYGKFFPNTIEKCSHSTAKFCLEKLHWEDNNTKGTIPYHPHTMTSQQFRFKSIPKEKPLIHKRSKKIFSTKLLCLRQHKKVFFGTWCIYNLQISTTVQIGSTYINTYIVVSYIQSCRPGNSWVGIGLSTFILITSL